MTGPIIVLARNQDPRVIAQEILFRLKPGGRVRVQCESAAHASDVFPFLQGRAEFTPVPKDAIIHCVGRETR